jgi:hypothetical protein
VAGAAVSSATYLLGVLVLAALAVPLCLAARSLRAYFLPDWSGALGVLADAVVAIALLQAIAQLVGTFGQLRRFWLAFVVVVSCAVIVILTRRRRAHASLATEPRSTASRSWRASTVVLAALVAALVLPWLTRSLSSLRTGVLGYDSLDYHLPFAGRFFQTGRVTSLYYTFPPLDTAFHPANDELVHAVGMVATQRDILSTVVNLGWIALALLAAWCAHPQRSVRPIALAAVGMLLAAPLFVAFSGGRATNDIAAIALFLASVAIVLNSNAKPAAVGLAAIASGMAVATKLTMIVPVLALTAGVIVIAVAGTRRKTAIVWLTWLVVTGSYWYLRNLFAVGNPVPALQVGLGPVSLPTPTSEGPYRSYSVAHYLTDFGIWRDWFVPGLRDAFGVAWPLILGLAATGLLLAILRGDRVLRMLGIVGVVAFIGYLFTPAGAGGASGRPVLFASDTRFAFAALALGLLLLPRLVPTTTTFGRRWLPALIGLGIVSDIAYSVKENVSLSAAAITIEAMALLAGIAVLLVWSTRSRRVTAAVLGGLLVIAVTAGWAVERSYLQRRYSNAARNLPYGSAPRTELVALYRWVSNVSDARIALNGLGISYPFFGEDLSNTVDYIGHRGAHGDFDEVRDCSEWRRLLNEGDYDYVVISPDAFTGSKRDMQPRVGRNDPEPVTAAWTRSDPAAAVQEVRAGKASVFHVVGKFDETGCPTTPAAGG